MQFTLLLFKKKLCEGYISNGGEIPTSVVIQEISLPLLQGKSLVRWIKGGFVKQDLREALAKVKNRPSFT